VYNCDQVILINKQMQLRFVNYKYLFHGDSLITFLIKAL